MDHPAIIKRALAHYQSKLIMETKQFRVKLVTHEYNRHNSHVLSNSGLWDAMSKDLDDYYQIIEQGQITGLIVSEYPIPRPEQHFCLHQLCDRLQSSLSDGTGNNIQDAIEDLIYYDGPYRLEIPEYTEESLS